MGFFARRLHQHHEYYDCVLERTVVKNISALLTMSGGVYISHPQSQDHFLQKDENEFLAVLV